MSDIFFPQSALHDIPSLSPQHVSIQLRSQSRNNESLPQQLVSLSHSRNAIQENGDDDGDGGIDDDEADGSDGIDSAEDAVLKSLAERIASGLDLAIEDLPERLRRKFVNSMAQSGPPVTTTEGISNLLRTIIAYLYTLVHECLVLFDAFLSHSCFHRGCCIVGDSFATLV
jgi:hypothetical protein